MVTFADDALVNDQLAGLLGPKTGHQGLGRTGHHRRKAEHRSYENCEALRNFVVTAEIDGNFDSAFARPARPGFYFTPHNDAINSIDHPAQSSAISEIRWPGVCLDGQQGVFRPADSTFNNILNV